MNFHFLNNNKLFLVVFNKLLTNKIDVFKQLFKSCFFYSIFALINSSAFADVPITFFDSYAGTVNYVGTEATRRLDPNPDSCLVMTPATDNTANISGIPPGASILAAHLYWAGGYSTQTGNTLSVPDYAVTFEGNNLTAPTSRQYTTNFTAGTFDLDFYSGVINVTAIVNSRTNPNGSYSFSGLSTNTGVPHCSPSGVTAGWSLLIVYDDPSETLRVINLYEGFEDFRGSSLTVNASNFTIPATGINGKYSALTWEGDAGNSATLDGFSEELSFNGTVLSDPANNPVNQQFNSISTTTSTLPSTGGVDTTSYGIDFDTYDISAELTTGDTSATTTYSSGGDLVLLSMEIISVSNTPVSDLAVTKTTTSAFSVGHNATYHILASNNGPNDEPSDIVITDSLPTGLSYVSATGIGWSCNAVGQDITCTRTSGLVDGASSAIVLTVAVSAAATPSASNTATISGTNFDNVPLNDTSTAVIAVGSPSYNMVKTSDTAIISAPGTINYTFTFTNTGDVALSNLSIVDPDAVLVGCPITTLAVGASDTCTGTRTITQVQIDAGIDLPNTAIPSAEDSSANPVTEDGTTDNTTNTEVEQMVDLSIIKKVDNVTANVGDTVTFSLEVSNTGPHEATDVNITDIVPAGFTYVAGSMTGISPIVTGITADESNPDSGTGLSWMITSLISGENTTFTFQADVQAP